MFGRSGRACLGLIVGAALGSAGAETSARGAEVPEAGKQGEGISLTKVVIYGLKAEEQLQAVAAQLNDDILVHLGEREDLIAVGESEIKVMLAHEKDKAVLMCEDEQRCFAQLQDVIHAEKVITGHLGRLGDTYLVTLKLADTVRAVVERAESAEADAVETLRSPTLEAVDRLLGIGGEAASRPLFQMQIAAEGTKAAVVDLAAHGVEAGLAENLTQLLSLELKKFKGLSVISRDEIQTMLRFEADKQVLQCKSDTSCLVEIGGALGVDYLVSGSVGRLGDAMIITLKLMDVHKAKVVNRASESFRGSEIELAPALRMAAAQLLGKPLTGAGSLQIEANVDEGQLSLDGGAPRAFPPEEGLDSLVAGKHGVTLQSEGYHPLFHETYVFDGQRTNLRLSLEEIPTPWYEEWWPWTILGVVVAGGVATAVVLTLQQQEPDGKVHVTVGGQ